MTETFLTEEDLKRLGLSSEGTDKTGETVLGHEDLVRLGLYKESAPEPVNAPGQQPITAGSHAARDEYKVTVPEPVKPKTTISPEPTSYPDDKKALLPVPERDISTTPWRERFPVRRSPRPDPPLLEAMLGHGKVSAYTPPALIGAATRWYGEVIQEAGGAVGRSVTEHVGGRVAEWGEIASKYWSEKAQVAAPEYEGTFWQNPSWQRAAGLTIEMFPLFAMAAGITVASGGNPTPAAAGLSFLEASGIYEESRKSGRNVVEASGHGSIAWATTFMLEKWGLDAIFKGGGRRLKRFVVGGATEGITESAQTVVQNIIAKYGYDETRNVWDAVVESFVGSIGLGGGASVALKTFQNSKVDSEDQRKITETVSQLVAEQWIDFEENQDKERRDGVFSEPNSAEEAQDRLEYLTRRRDDLVASSALINDPKFKGFESGFPEFRGGREEAEANYEAITREMRRIQTWMEKKGESITSDDEKALDVANGADVGEEKVVDTGEETTAEIPDSMEPETEPGTPAGIVVEKTDGQVYRDELRTRVSEAGSVTPLIDELNDIEILATKIYQDESIKSATENMESTGSKAQDIIDLARGTLQNGEYVGGSKIQTPRKSKQRQDIHVVKGKTKGKYTGEYDGWSVIQESKYGQWVKFLLFSENGLPIDVWVEQQRNKLISLGIDPSPDGVWEVLDKKAREHDDRGGNQNYIGATEEELRSRELAVMEVLFEMDPVVHDLVQAQLVNGISAKDIATNIDDAYHNDYINERQLEDIQSRVAGPVVEDVSFDPDEFEEFTEEDVFTLEQQDAREADQQARRAEQPDMFGGPSVASEGGLGADKKGVATEETELAKGIAESEYQSRQITIDQAMEELNKVRDELAENADLGAIDPDIGLRIKDVGKQRPEGPPREDSIETLRSELDHEATQIVQENKGIPREPLTTRLKDKIKEWFRSWRWQPNMPDNAFFSQFREGYRVFQAANEISIEETVRALKGMVAGLDKYQFELYAWKVLYENELENVSFGLEPAFHKGDDAVERLKKDMDVINGRLAGEPSVMEALRRRHEYWDKLSNLVKAAYRSVGMNAAAERLSKKEYMRQQVISYAVEQAKPDAGGARIKSPTGRSYLKKRSGGTPYNTLLLEAEYEIILTLHMDVMKLQLINMINEAGYNIQSKLKRDAKNINYQNMLAILDPVAAKWTAEARENYKGKDPSKAKVWTAEDVYRSMFNKKIAIGYDMFAREAIKQEDFPGSGDPKWQAVMTAFVENYQANKAAEKAHKKDVKTRGFVRAELDPSVQARMMSYLSYVLDEYVAKDESGMRFKSAASTVFSGMADKAKNTREMLENNGYDHQTWETLAKETEGYEVWAPGPDSVFHMAYSIPERLALEALEDVNKEVGISAKDINKVFAKAAGQQWVIPSEIKEVLEKHGVEKSGAGINRRLIRIWKQIQLIGPRRFFKYNFRNLTGDADHMFIGNPDAFKHIPGSMRELWKYYRQGVLSNDIKRFFEMAGLQVTLQAQEMGDINKIKAFIDIFEKKDANIAEDMASRTWNAWIKYWHAARLATDFRESVLRFAAYKSFLAQMREDPNGRPKTFGASVPESVMALPTLEQRAFKMQNELLGAYDQISSHGRWLRENAFPFWSWKEVNMKIYANLARNAMRDPVTQEVVARNLLGKQGARLAAVTARRVGVFTLKVFALHALLTAWNHGMRHDEEESLPESQRARPHITLGRDDKTGEVLLFTNVGALSDLLAAFGLSDYQGYINKYCHGEMTLKEIAIDMAKTPVNQVVMGIYPIQKGLFEAGLRRSSFPDFFEPRTIRDRGAYLANSLGYEQEYRFMKRLLSGEKVPGGRMEDYVRSIPELFLYRSDPYKSAYNDTYETFQRFQQRRDKGSQGFWLSEASMYLWNWRTAKKLRDGEAQKYWYNRYLEAKLGRDVAAGMPGISKRAKRLISDTITSMDPLSNASEDDRLEFMASLNPRQTKRLQTAYLYYCNVILEMTPKEAGDRFKELGIPLPEQHSWSLLAEIMASKKEK